MHNQNLSAEKMYPFGMLFRKKLSINLIKAMRSVSSYFSQSFVPEMTPGLWLPLHGAWCTSFSAAFFNFSLSLWKRGDKRVLSNTLYIFINMDVANKTTNFWQRTYIFFCEIIKITCWEYWGAFSMNSQCRFHHILGLQGTVPSLLFRTLAFPRWKADILKFPCVVLGEKS